MPILRQVRMMRHAISPRLATNMRPNGGAVEEARDRARARTVCLHRSMASIGGMGGIQRMNSAELGRLGATVERRAVLCCAETERRRVECGRSRGSGQGPGVGVPIA
jgi:hypothetical protein